MDDHVLLRRFVEKRANDAFAALVERHVNLVYFAALRQTGGNTAMAEDIAQEVFADLARKAASLVDRPVLAGWLYTSTRYAAANARRAEGRRRAREQEAYAMQEIMRDDPTPTDWERARPLIDDALHTLSDTEREAVLLRFFEGRAFAEIGVALRLTEEAARKRVERAVDKLAAVLTRRGVTSTSAALGAALAAQSAFAAPAGLATTLAGSALAGAGAAAGGAVVGAAAVGILTSMKTTAIVGVVAAAAIGTAFFQAKTVKERDASVAALAGELGATKASIHGLETQLAAANKRAAAAEDDNAKLLAAIRSQSAARTAAATAGRSVAPAEDEPITHDAVEARYRRAQELAKTGDPSEALRELLWCFDKGMVGVASYGGVRNSFLLSLIAKLGERHPPAIAALQERRDRAEKRLLVSERDHDAVSTFGAINRVLKESDRTLAVFDQLPPGDRRRRTLASSAMDTLLEAKRYNDAIEARSFEQMVSFFGTLKQSSGATPDRRRSTVAYVAKYVEILAGAGEVAHAREFAQQVLAFDDSPETRAVLEKHAARAGRDDLLKGLGVQ